MKSNKEYLLKQRAAIDLALSELEEQDLVEQKRKKAAAFAALGQYTPLKNAIVKEDIFFVTGDEQIETYGYATAREILANLAFEANEELVLILTSDNKKIWVSKKEDGNYQIGRWDHHMTEGEAEDYITISQ